MEVKDIQKLMRTFKDQGLSEMELTEGDFTLRLKREMSAAPATMVQSTPAPSTTAGPVDESVPKEESVSQVETPEDEDLVMVESPIIGTFYRAPNPDADPYVNVGDTVNKGQVLCIIEAMKIMNEIEAEISGTIVKIFPRNGEAVEYGQKLFAVRPM